MLAGGREVARQLGVRAAEIGAVRFARPALQHAHQVDHGIATAQNAGELRRIARVDLDHLDGGQHEQVLGAFAPARGHDHRLALIDQHAHHVAADKSAAAKNDYPIQFHCGSSSSAARCAMSLSLPPRGAMVPRRAFRERTWPPSMAA